MGGIDILAILSPHRPFSFVVAPPPAAGPGLEHTLPAGWLHHTLPAGGVLHHALPEARLHHTVPEEDLP